jgi:hypothetical protein
LVVGKFLAPTRSRAGISATSSATKPLVLGHELCLLF